MLKRAAQGNFFPRPYVPEGPDAEFAVYKRYNWDVSDSRPIRCEVHYTGQVQGVGFRWNTCDLARDFSVTGFVRNLPDGRVHLVAEGERGEVKRFLSAIAQMMARNIRQAQTVVSQATGEYPRFETTR